MKIATMFAVSDILLSCSYVVVLLIVLWNCGTVVELLFRRILISMAPFGFSIIMKYPWIMTDIIMPHMGSLMGNLGGPKISEAHLKVFGRKKYIETSYMYGGKEYKAQLPFDRDSKLQNATMVVDGVEEGCLDKVLPYAGPGGDFYGLPFVPKHMIDPNITKLTLKYKSSTIEVRGDEEASLA